MFLQNGVALADEGFTHDDVTYPPGWLALASEDERAAIGVEAVPDRPSQWHEWDGSSWVLSDPNAVLYKADVQASIWTKIKDRRTQVQAGGFQVGTDWFQSDANSRVQYLGLKDRARDVLAAGGQRPDPIMVNGVEVQWKTYTNTFIPVTVQLAIDLVDCVSVLDAAAFARAELHRAAMLQAADPSAYDYSDGWPANYQG